jgi:UDP-glucose 4-epimerase
MSILVTGGNGFLGTRVVRKLLDRGEEVVVGDIQTFTPEDIQEGVKTATVDVRQFSDLTRIICDFEVGRIIHLAYSGTQASERFPSLSIEIDCLGTTNVFEAARTLRVKRIVFASSIAVYGPQDFYGERAVTEEDLIRPSILYGAAKVINEFTAAKYIEKFGIEIPSLRIAVTCGPGRQSGVTAWVSQLVTNLAQDKPVFAPIRSDDFMGVIHVDDVAELLVKLCLAEKLKYKIYNTGAHTVSGKEIHKIARKHFPNANVKFDEDAPLLLTPYRIDGSRIAEEFNWKMSDLETTLLEVK